MHARVASAPRGVTVDQHREYRRQGFLVVRGLVPAQDIDGLREHTEALMRGELRRECPEEDLPAPPPAHLSAAEKAQYYLRIHMLHRRMAIHERWLLHPRVLDVVAGLVGPDVLALQSMLFLKPPGHQGQGWHQDSFYIPTTPDSLIGAWIAIDGCDEYNGAMWFAAGSQVEPTWPGTGTEPWSLTGDRHLADIRQLAGASNEDERNELAAIAAGYPQVLAAASPGDVVFFHGHVLHRSKRNVTTDRFRRSFVGHYCNARSYTNWGAFQAADDPHRAPITDSATGMTNASHILARGSTHLPHARPRFGTPTT